MLVNNSIINKINPLVKLGGLFIYILISLLKYNVILLVCNVGIVFLLMLFSNVSYKSYLKILWYLKVPIVLFYMILHNKLGVSFSDINLLFVKILFFIFYVYLIIVTTSREDLGKSNSLIVDQFNFFGFPRRKIEMFFTNLYSYIVICRDSLKKILFSKEISGDDYTYSHIIDKGKNIIKSREDIQRLNQMKYEQRKNDMKYRMFNGNIKNRYKYKSEFSIYDYIYLGVMVSLIVFYIVRVR